LADWIVVIALIVTFAAFVVSHVALSAMLLLFHKPRWRGPVALVLPPLAPFWGYVAGRKRLAIFWAICLAGYVVARIAAAALPDPDAQHAALPRGAGTEAA